MKWIADDFSQGRSCGMSKYTKNSEHLLALLNEMLSPLTHLRARSGEDPCIIAFTKLFLTVWNRYQDAVCMAEMRSMMDEAEIELEDYSDFEKCISELKKHCDQPPR